MLLDTTHTSPPPITCHDDTPQQTADLQEPENEPLGVFSAGRCLLVWCMCAGALVDSEGEEAAEDADGWDEEPMIAGLGSLRCANGSLCVSPSVTYGVSHSRCV